MEQKQPLKKRLIEVPSTTTGRREPQRTSRIIKHNHFMSVDEIRVRVARERNPQIEEQNREVQQSVASSTTCQIVERVSPMMLNAWTQTNFEEIENSDTYIDKLHSSVLTEKLNTLERTLNQNLEFINCNMSHIKGAFSEKEKPKESSNPPSTPESKTEVQTYRILSQGNEANSDESIEIELSVENEVVNNENSPPSQNVYKIRTSSKDETPKIVKKESSPLPIGSGSPKKPVDGEPCVLIGPNNTKVPEGEFNKISWGSASIATRKLLTLIFDRETLATHSMTGKASPAFKDLDKPVKGRLDPNCVQDIIDVVSKKCGVSSKEVRSAITTKCADENKMLKLKEMKKLSAEPKRPILGELRPRNSGQNAKLKRINDKE